MDDDRSSHAKAMSLASGVLTIAFMMAIPALLGYFLDVWLGTIVVFMFLGVVFGVGAGVWQLVKLVQSFEQAESQIQQDKKVQDGQGQPQKKTID